MATTALERANRDGWQAALALALAIVLGGGGSPAPLFEIALQLSIAVIAALWLWSLDRSFAGSVPRTAIAIAALMLAVPLFQLIPLPPVVWQALSGRGMEKEALDLVGRAGEWQTWSLAPNRTLASVLALLPAAFMVIMTATLEPAGRRQLVFVAALGALTALVLGAGQLSGGPAGPLRFHSPDSTWLDGFQANHNSSADVQLIGLLAAVTAIRELALRGSIPNRRPVVLGLALATVALFGIGVILTGSRAGMALLTVAFPAALFQLRPWLRLSRRELLLMVAAVGTLALLAVLAATRNAAVANVTQRFAITTELRPDLWRDSLYAARTYFPFGAGIGNFVPAMLPFERLEIVRVMMPNRAHNEFLELAVEAGVFGLAAYAAIVALLVSAFRSARSNSIPGTSGVNLFAITALLVLGLHSLVDYPFRSMSLALLAATCAGLLVPRRVAPVRGNQSDRQERTQ